MKKLVCLTLALVLLLTACMSPMYKMDDQHKKYAEKAIEIADAYLDFDMTADEAYTKISALHDAEDTLPSVEKGDELYDGNFIVESEVFLLYCAISDAKFKRSGSDVLERRNTLATTIGKSKR